jgi:hypothetical protein
MLGVRKTRIDPNIWYGYHRWYGDSRSTDEYREEMMHRAIRSSAVDLAGTIWQLTFDDGLWTATTADGETCQARDTAVHREGTWSKIQLGWLVDRLWEIEEKR